MIWKSPAVRISLVFVGFVIALLLLADLLGLVPNRAEILLDARKKVSESVAISVIRAIERKDIPLAKGTLDSLVERNDDVRSAGLRQNDGKVLLAAGDHAAEWGDYDGETSTISHVTLPIYSRGKPWGKLEIRFASLYGEGVLASLLQSDVSLFLFIGPACFLGFLFVLKRILRELDPSAVIPGRVYAALDTLAEGLLVVDDQECIVLANGAFARQIGQPAAKLIGRKISELDWIVRSGADKTSGHGAVLPWTRTLQGGTALTGESISVQTGSGSETIFLVNCTPILGEGQAIRGLLATFDDITERERQKEELEISLEKLEQSQDEIKRQNEELHFLATRDPLTGSLNRRSLNEQFDSLFREAGEKGLALACLMTDIDHFKSVNDTYGHAVGDKTIKLLAEVLHSVTRAGDLVARFGGEEFCLVLPGADLAEATAVAERVREIMEATAGTRIGANRPITCSLGVSAAVAESKSYSEMITQADTALYVAKKSGRNRVIGWAGEETVKQLEALTEAEKRSGITGRGAPSNPPEVAERLKQLEAVNLAQSKEIHFLTHFDALTGLPNRAAFQDRLNQDIARAQRRSEIIAVLAIGVDMLERIKTAFGYCIGDAILQEVVRRISSILRSSDIVAQFNHPEEAAADNISRLEVDKFGILLTDLKNEDAITWVVKRISDVLANVFDIESQNVFLSSNIGVSVYPRDGEDAETLVGKANVARLHARNLAQTHSVQFYADDINQRSIDMLLLAGDMRAAVARGEFYLLYQPIVSASTGAIEGVEALLRWRHPDRGTVSPEVFIPIAEQTGLIVELGYWICAEACHQISAWNAEGIADLNVSVNISAVQFRQPDLGDRILAIVRETGVDPQQLSIEITESTLIYDFDAAVTIIRQLRDAGMTVCADDFGTGYSSLLYLKDFPIDLLKVDRAFVRDMTANPSDNKMVTAIIAMARSMGCLVIAEGVETPEQRDLLVQLGSDGLQGYLFGYPSPPQQILELWNKAGENEVTPRLATLHKIRRV